MHETWLSLKNRLTFATGSCIVSIMGLLRENNVFMLEYKHGFNIHFHTTLEKLSKVVPKRYTPNPIRVVEGEHEPLYMVTMYLAETRLRGTSGSFGRGDVFTYVVDTEDKKMALFFLGSIQQAPPFRGLPRKMYDILMDYFRMDPLDEYSLPYPHAEASEILVGKDSFSVVSTDGSSIISMSDGNVLTTGVFTGDFVRSNSRVYRGDKGTRNELFFNQDFMDARVTRYDPSRVDITTPSHVHPACGEVVLVESYGDDASPLSWYMEVS